MPRKSQESLAEKSARIRKRLAGKSAALKPADVRSLKKRVKRAQRRVRLMKDLANRVKKKAGKKEQPAG